MSGQLMLVNPKKRRRARPKRRAKRRTVARRRRNPVAALAANPRRRKRRSVSRKRITRRRRRNPIKMNMRSMLNNMIMPSVTAAGGAIGIDVLMGFLPLPDTLKSGPMRHLVKGAVAIGAGMLAQNFVKPKTAELFVTGALTVTMYGAGRELLTRFAPGIAAKAGLSGLGYYDDEDLMGLGYSGAGYTGLDTEDMQGLGYYESEDMQGLGAYDDIEEFSL